MKRLCDTRVFQMNGHGQQSQGAGFGFLPRCGSLSSQASALSWGGKGGGEFSEFFLRHLPVFELFVHHGSLICWVFFARRNLFFPTHPL